jgi:hypothetical protein
MKKNGNKNLIWLKRNLLKKHRNEIYRKERRRNRRLEGSGKRQTRTHKTSFEDHILLDLPVNFNLYNNYGETIDLIQKLRETALHKKRNVLLRFDQIKDIDPASMLCLVAEIDRCNKKNSKTLEVTGTYPKDPIVEILLEVMGFFDLLKKQKRRLFNESILPIKIIKFISNTGARGVHISRLKKALLEGLYIKKGGASTRLYGSLMEAMTNVGHHAYPEGVENPYPFLSGRWWMVGAIDPKKMLTAIFYDQGVGIPATASINYKDSLLESAIKMLFKSRKDGEIIHSVITEGQTRTKEKNRGKGLRDMANLIDTIGGNSSFRVLSGHGDYTYFPASSGKPVYKNNKKSLCGTLIEWKIPLNSIIMEREPTNK